MPACTHCGKEVEASFRFCPWCGIAQRRKLVEFFRPHPNSPGRALRVSRYYGDDPQVRFSVWDDGVARAAVSLDEEEAQRLAAFLGSSTARSATRLRSNLVAALRERRLQPR
jgi:zinc-ribbon domain